MNKHYSEEQKINIIRRYHCGETVTKLSQSTGISRSTLYQWIKDINCNKSIKPVNMRGYHELKSKCERQEKIISILKGSPFIAEATLHDKYSVIDTSLFRD